MAINEKYENVDDYKFIEKNYKKMKPKYRKITMEDLFDGDDSIIIDEDELNEIDTQTMSSLSKDSDSKTYYVPSSKIADTIKIKDRNANIVITKESMDVEKTKTGYLVLSKRLNNGDLFKRKYMDYTEKEAKSKFKKEFDIENKKTLKEGGCGCGGGKKSIKEADDNTIEIFYVMDSKGNVKNLSRSYDSANNFLEKSLKGNGKIGYKDVSKKDYMGEKVTVSNIKTYKLNEGGCGCGGGKKSIKEADIMGRRSLPGIGGAAPGVGMYSKISKDNAKENKVAYEESMKKVSKYNDIKLKPQMVDNGGTAKTALGDDNTKKYGVENDEAYIEELAKSGMNNLDLDYDREPSEKFKERVKKSLDGDESVSMKIANKRKELQNKQSVYHTFYKDPKPMKDLVNNYKAFGKNKNVEESISSIVDRIIKEAIKMKEVKKAKPDFLDLDKDGDKKEPMKKAAKDAKKGKPMMKKSKIFKKKDMKESEGGWVTILDNNDMKEINSTPQPKVERPSANMSISTGFASVSLGSLRVENAENLDKVVLPEDYKIEGYVFEISDNNRTAKVRFEEGNLIVLSDNNRKMVSEETSKIMKLMNYNYNTKPAAKSVMTEDVNATLKKMLSEVKGLTKE
jgi:hypothetical protein